MFRTCFPDVKSLLHAYVGSFESRDIAISQATNMSPKSPYRARWFRQVRSSQMMSGIVDRQRKWDTFGPEIKRDNR